MAGEDSGSGRRSSRFTVTCSLLRQYMAQNKQQRQAQVANLARLFQAPPPPPLPPVAPAGENERRTVQLFPVRAGATVAHPAQQMPEVMVAPMTIFYGGQVIRVDNVPADKGMALMQMAKSVNAPPPQEKVVVVDVPDEEPEVVAEPSAAITAIQARRLSLQRFLRKRKERNDPDYNDDELPPKKIGGGGGEPWEDDVPDASWLSL
ncbi:protein TIFY 11d-like [Setaria viridis]|uniref:Protein TIFY n=1 Tax=Setaria viridis TaxID=4556 RepID=A0A4U6T073_SETVI|nr:hypothetical protein SEVIR_9G255500v2 [Setaria viridis]